mmetsp:Transcript_18083/g.31205  ORF Transcript_18083/g.31205 Transcript_18083/m.31205 type:complete len:235 (-) Transcript_18083:571-1275(-)
MPWDASAEMRKLLRRATSAASAGHDCWDCVSRLMSSARRGEPAPWDESDPTSSWSKRTIARVSVSACSCSSSSHDAISALVEQKVEMRLSRRGEYTNSSNSPPMVEGCVSVSSSSKSMIDSGSTLSSLARAVRSTGWCFFSIAELADGVTDDPLTACSSALTAEQRTGWRWFCLLNLKASFTSGSRWIASDGIRSIGFLRWTNRVSNLPPAVRMMTRPARVRSRSNQVYQRPPP